MRVLRDVLKCVVFLCRQRQIEGATKVVPSGTGFLVSVQVVKDVFVHYVVTSRHVVESDRMGYLMIRANTKEGKTRDIDTLASDWLVHEKADVAILPFAKADDLDVTSVHYPSHFTGENGSYVIIFKDQTVSSGHVPIPYHIWTGDEVVAIGLLAEDYGDSVNLPIARFGHIARMPSLVNTPRWEGDKFRSVAYLAEFMALPGLSGSPVLWFAATNVISKMAGGYTKTENKLIPALVGCVNGYIPRPEKPEITGDLPGDIRVKMNTGISTVTQASEIESLIQSDELVKQRDEIANRHAEQTNYVTPSLVCENAHAIHEPFFMRTRRSEHEESPTLARFDRRPLQLESGPRSGTAADL